MQAAALNRSGLEAERGPPLARLLIGLRRRGLRVPRPGLARIGVIAETLLRDRKVGQRFDGVRIQSERALEMSLCSPIVLSGNRDLAERVLRRSMQRPLPRDLRRRCLRLVETSALEVRDGDVGAQFEMSWPRTLSASKLGSASPSPRSASSLRAATGDGHGRAPALAELTRRFSSTCTT